MRTKILSTAVLVSIACAATRSNLWGQSASKPSASVWDGIFTEEQAKRGAALYATNCKSCHGAELEGKGQTPALTGAEFTSFWDGMSVGLILEAIQSSMPADRPGQLPVETNASILAFILQSNKFPAGTSELPADADALKKIRFDAKKK